MTLREEIASSVDMSDKARKSFVEVYERALKLRGDLKASHNYKLQFAKFKADIDRICDSIINGEEN